MSSSEEEEEILVHVEFNGMLEKDVLEQRPVFFKMIGIDESKPVMQIGNQTFTGEYRDIVGTSLFFEEDKTPSRCDPVFTKTPEHQLHYACKTRKMLQMSRVFLKKKQPVEDCSKNAVGADNSDLVEDVNASHSFKGKSAVSRTSSSDEVTMEIDEDSVLLGKRTTLGVGIPRSTSDLETLVKATNSGEATAEVDKIVEEQIKHVTDEAINSENT